MSYRLLVGYPKFDSSLPSLVKLKAALQHLYGANVEHQLVRYTAALHCFIARYGPGNISFFRAPGRVNLIGEHTDYNHGYVLPLALKRDILLLARPRADSIVRVSNVEADFPPFSFAISEQIAAALTGDWSNYVRGAAQSVARTHDHQLSGMDALVAGGPPFGIPRGAGLSSSSALTVLAAIALVHFSGQAIAGQALAQVCAEAEWYTGTRGGIMDHFSLLLCQHNHAMLLNCRPCRAGHYQVEHLLLPKGYRLLIADSGVQHQNTRGEYNHRVAACRAGVELLRSRYPDITHLRDVQQIPWRRLRRLLPELTTPAELHAQGISLGDLPGVSLDTPLPVRRRCYHVWSENRRVLAAAAAIRAGNASRLGELLDDAHASVRDHYDASCAELETLVKLMRQLPGVLGARLTGAGWGGCAIALVEESRSEEARQQIQARYEEASEVKGAAFEPFNCRPGLHGGFVGQVSVEHIPDLNCNEGTR